MAAFDEAALTYLDSEGQDKERLDWAMLRYGPVALFRKTAVGSDVAASRGPAVYARLVPQR